jgi:hypothetical protein
MVYLLLTDDATKNRNSNDSAHGCREMQRKTHKIFDLLFNQIMLQSIASKGISNICQDYRIKKFEMFEIFNLPPFSQRF